MAESSGGRDIPKWRCSHCPAEFLGFSPDLFDFCPECGEPQKEEHASDIPVKSCINPKCGETLSPDKATVCHACETPQSPKVASMIPVPSKSVEEHKMKIAQAVASKKQPGQQVGSSDKPLVSTEKAGDQVKYVAPDAPIGCQAVVEIEENQVTSDISTPSSSLMDSDASLPGLGDSEKTSTSAPAPRSSPEEQSQAHDVEPDKTAAASSDATSTVDQKAQNLKKTKPEENSENNTKEGTQRMS